MCGADCCTYHRLIISKIFPKRGPLGKKAPKRLNVLLLKKPIVCKNLRRHWMNTHNTRTSQTTLRAAANPSVLMKTTKKSPSSWTRSRGPRSNFEIGGGGGGGTISDSILGGGGTRYFFLLNLFNFKNIGGGSTCPPCPPYSVVPAQSL